MLYLSRLMVDTRNRLVRRDLGNCHQLHRTLLSAFPQVPAGVAARKHFGVLYRAEPLDNAPALVRLLIQSHVPPDWSRLPTGYLAPAPDDRGNPALRSIDAEYERIAPGMQLVFRLRANPTKRISNRDPQRDDKLLGKRVALLGEAEQLDWLGRKGAQHGFRPVALAAQPEHPDVRSSVQGQDRGRRPAGAGASAMDLRFGAVLFNGRLEVTDRDAFLAALAQGIGSGKAFGFGLLSVAATS